MTSWHCPIHHKYILYQAGTETGLLNNLQRKLVKRNNTSDLILSYLFEGIQSVHVSNLTHPSVNRKIRR